MGRDATIEGAPPSPLWQIVLAKATAKFLSVVAVGFVVYVFLLISLETWPAINARVAHIGVKQFVSPVRGATRVQVAGLAVLFAFLYWRTNTVTRSEYVRPNGTPVVVTSAHYATATALGDSSRPIRAVGHSPAWFGEYSWLSYSPARSCSSLLKPACWLRLINGDGSCSTMHLNGMLRRLLAFNLRHIGRRELNTFPFLG